MKSRFRVLLAILLAVLIVGVLSLLLFFMGQEKAQREYEQTHRAIILTNEAVDSPIPVTRLAKSWTPAPTETK